MDDAGDLDPATVELAQCSSGIRDVTCNAVVQAGNLHGCAVVVVTAADDVSHSQGSSGTVDCTHNDTAGTMIDPGAVEMRLVQPQVSNGTNDNAGEVEVQTGSTPNPATMASEPTPGTVHARERS